MSVDVSTLPFSPFLIVIAVGYAGVSALVTGPAIIERENEKSGWHGKCQSELVEEIDATRRPERAIPQVPDVGGILCGVYPELDQLCQLMPNPNAAAREAERLARLAEARRIERATSATAEACSCAEQVLIEQQRLSIALYAATGRLISPPTVTERNAGLSRALRSPSCSREG